MDFSYEIIEDDNIAVITTPERIDASNSNEMKELITNIVSKNIYKIVVDLSNTNFIDSSGLGALVSRISICKNNNGDVRLVVLSDRVKEVLEITHLNKILKLFQNKEDAIRSFKEV